MDFVFQWFWIVKLVLFIIFAFTFYKCISNKFKSKAWNFAAIIVSILAVVSPVKIDSQAVTNAQNNRANVLIKNSKILPEKVTDDSFKEGTKGLGITEFKAD